MEHMQFESQAQRLCVSFACFMCCCDHDVPWMLVTIKRLQMKEWRLAARQTTRTKSHCGSPGTREANCWNTETIAIECLLTVTPTSRHRTRITNAHVPKHSMTG